LAALHPGVEMQLAGLTPVAVSASRGMITDLGRSLAFAAIVIFGFIALAYRSGTLGLVSVVPNVLPLLAVTTVLVFTLGSLQYASVAVLSIGLGLAVDDTIHLLTAYRRRGGRAAGRRAVEDAIRTVGVALCATTVVLLAGLGPLVLSGLPTVQLFGALICVLLVAALVADLVFLPALLVLVSDRAPEPVSPVAPAEPLGAKGGA